MAYMQLLKPMMNRSDVCD